MLASGIIKISNHLLHSRSRWRKTWVTMENVLPFYYKTYLPFWIGKIIYNSRHASNSPCHIFQLNKPITIMIVLSTWSPFRLGMILGKAEQIKQTNPPRFFSITTSGNFNRQRICNKRWKRIVQNVTKEGTEQ